MKRNSDPDSSFMRFDSFVDRTLRVLRILAGIAAAVIVGIILAALSGCGGGGGGGGGGGFAIAAPAPAPAAEPAPPPAEVEKPVCSVDLFGDSITVGASFSKGNLAVPIAQRMRLDRAGWIVTDYSQSGQSAAWLAPSFPNMNRTGRAVVLALGTNDFTLDASPAEPLRKMADYAKAEGRRVIIAGIPAMQHTRLAEFNADELRIAGEVGATWAGWPDVDHETVDGVHPTQAMSDALAAKLIAAVEAALPECKQ